ncbi:11822_t:CDS:2, partial [Racocetra fulgida]
MKAIVEKGNKNHKQSDLLDMEEIKFILDSSATATDTPKDNREMRLKLSTEKNHARGIKDLYAKTEISFILPDTVGNKYTPVADIKKYLSKCPNNIENDYFFITTNTPKKIYRDAYSVLKDSISTYNNQSDKIDIK